MIRKLARGAGMYAAAFLAPRVLRLALVPLVVNAIGFEKYGVFVLVSLVLPFAMVFCDAGLGTAALRLAPHEPADARPSLFASVLAFRAAAVVAVATLLVLLRAPIAHRLTGSTENSWAVFYVAGTLVVAPVMSALFDQLRSEERHTVVAGASAARDVAEATATFALVIVLRLGLLGMLLGRLVADVCVLVYVVAQCRSTFRARPRLATVSTLLRLGMPIGLLYLLVVFRELDRYLIKQVLGVAHAARYDLALRVVGPVALGNAALTMVLEPFVFRTYVDPRAGAAIGSFLRAYVVCFGVVAFGVAAIAPEIFPFLARDPDVHAAVIAPALVFAFLGDGILRVAGIGADLSKRTIVWMVVAITHVAIALPLTWFLLRPLGIFGAGLALVGGSLVSAEVAYALARRLFPLELPVHRAIVVAAIGVSGATLLVGGLGPIAPLAVRLAAVLVFAAVAWAVASPNTSELRGLLRARGEG
jgi:O-antigen/teichoic acid export membrane protein